MQMGYIGIGSMGGALARRLQTAHKLIVNDIDQAAVNRFVSTGAEAASLRELAARCDVIFLCLPTSAHVREVIFGENGLHSELRAGTFIVDQTTGDPEKTREMAAALAADGVELIDAPVSGGVMGAEAGTIAIIIGASDEQFARIRPLVEAISPNISHAGGVGTGQVMKLVTNMIAFSQRVATLEGLALTTKMGVDPETAVDILLAGGARNKYMEVLLGPKVIRGDLRTGFTLSLALKDLNLMAQIAIDHDVPMPLNEVSRQLYASYVDELGADSQVETSALAIQGQGDTRFIPEDYVV